MNRRLCFIIAIAIILGCRSSDPDIFNIRNTRRVAATGKGFGDSFHDAYDNALKSAISSAIGVHLKVDQSVIDGVLVKDRTSLKILGTIHLIETLGHTIEPSNVYSCRIKVIITPHSRQKRWYE